MLEGKTAQKKKVKEGRKKERKKKKVGIDRGVKRKTQMRKDTSWRLLKLYSLTRTEAGDLTLPRGWL